MHPSDWYRHTTGRTPRFGAAKRGVYATNMYGLDWMRKEVAALLTELYEHGANWSEVEEVVNALRGPMTDTLEEEDRALEWLNRLTSDTYFHFTKYGLELSRK